MLLIAILRGADYDQVRHLWHTETTTADQLKIGLRGCGEHIAHRLAHYGLGESLLAATEDLTIPQLQVFLQGWRETLRWELKNDTRGFLGRKYGVLAESVPDTWPDPAVLRLHIHPVTSASPGSPAFDVSEWKLCLPDLQKLARLCNGLFGWEPGPRMLKTFQSNVWPGLCLRRLCMVSSSISVISSSLITIYSR